MAVQTLLVGQIQPERRGVDGTPLSDQHPATARRDPGSRVLAPERGHPTDRAPLLTRAATRSACLWLLGGTTHAGFGLPGDPLSEEALPHARRRWRERGGDLGVDGRRGLCREHQIRRSQFDRAGCLRGRRFPVGGPWSGGREVGVVSLLSQADEQPDRTANRRRTRQRSRPDRDRRAVGEAIPPPPESREHGGLPFGQESS
jgi:hypothetical protein